MFYFYKKILLYSFIFLLLVSHATAQRNSLSSKLIYVSSSKIYLFPEASDLILRKKNLPIENIWGISIEYRRIFNEDKYGLGINIDYIRKTINLNTFGTTDGFWSIPIEVTAYFFIPLGLEKWKIFMGGGIGAYLGGRLLTKENSIESSSGSSPGYGIHILGGIEYYFYRQFAIKTQMKFRDLSFKTSNKFYSNQDDFNNTSIDYKSRINVDGMILELGIVYSF